VPRQSYPSDLTDAEWTVLAPLIPAPKAGGRPPIMDRRELVNALRSVLRGGIAWRALPHDLAPWQTVSHSVRRWRLDGTWERANAQLRQQVRAGRTTPPTAPMLHSQSVRTTE
jgi:putative transposase